MINAMKYNSNYECVQNCTPGTQLLHANMNGDLAAIPAVDKFVCAAEEEVSKSITSINSDDKKSVSRKTCTCSSGLMPCPCPSHSGSERSSIIMNGYTNGYTHYQQAHRHDRIKIPITAKRINTPTCNKAPSQEKPVKNGKIIHKTTTKKVQQRIEDTLPSSRTFTIEPNTYKTNNRDNNATSNSNERDFNVNSHLDELRLSLTSLISKDESESAPDERQATEAFQKWLAEKKRQEREIRQRELNLKQLIREEKQRKIQMERENFLNWLQAKKQKERIEKETKKKALEEEQRRKKEKLKREEINKKQYQLWLKLKEEQDLVKKINEQKRKIEKEEREQQRLARNQSAFQEWLISSKDKPKPVPLNRGLESLRTSTSVAFINPAPWVPNIVEKTKAKSK